MADKPKVVDLPRVEGDKLAGAVDEFRRKLPAMIEHHKLLARLQRAAFVNYVREGFTEDQALELVKGIR